MFTLFIMYVTFKREVLEDIEKKEKEQQKKDSPAVKKEVDFLPHTPPKVKSKNVAGPPVYYPPGSAEFTKKEEFGAAMSQSSVIIILQLLSICCSFFSSCSKYPLLIS